MGVPLYYCCADVVKLADTPDLGSGAPRREGSSPFIRTITLSNTKTFPKIHAFDVVRNGTYRDEFLIFALLLTKNSSLTTISEFFKT